MIFDKILFQISRIRPSVSILTSTAWFLADESRDASSPKQSRFELMYMEYKENKKYNVHVRSEQCQSHVADPNTQILANSRIYRETIIIGA